MTVPPTPPSQPVGRLLTPAEVALAFRVDRKTVARWAADGRLSSIRTPGGHRRFREDEVTTLLAIVDQVEQRPQSGSSAT